MSDQSVVPVFGTFDRVSGTMLGVGPLGSAYTPISGGGGGGTPSTQLPNLLSTTPAIGTSTAFMRADAVLQVPTALQTNSMPRGMGTWDITNNIAYDVHGTSIGPLVTDTAPSFDANFVIINAVTAVTTSLSPTKFSAGVNGDTIFFDGVHFDKIGVNSIGRTTTGIQKGDGTSGSGGSSLVDAAPGIDFMPGLAVICNVPVGRLPDGTIGTNGALTVGTQVGGGTLTFSQATAGSGVTCTESGGTAPFVTTDVGRYITVGGVSCPITTYNNSTQVLVTIPASGISSVTQTTWALGTPLINVTNGIYSYGLWVYFPANVITGSNVAGFYWVVMVAGTLGTVYNNIYTPGTNTGTGSFHVPTTLVAFSGTTGTAYAAGTATIATHSVTISGMGANGDLETKIYHRNNNSAGSKTVKQTLGGQSLGYNVSATTGSQNRDGAVISNRGYTNRQESLFQGEPIHGGTTGNGGNVDTTTPQPFVTLLSNAAATDWNVIETLKVILSPGA